LIKHWNVNGDSPIMMESVKGSGAFRFFHLLDSGWAANIDTHYLQVEPATSKSLMFDVDRHVTYTAVSPDRRYIVTAVAGEITVVDILHNAVASLSISSDYIGFAAAGLLAICVNRGLFILPLDKLEYTNF